MVIYKFTGKERDTETGLDNFGARYHASTMGRFLSPDPFNPLAQSRSKFEAWISNPQRWNKYGYALNNPLVYIDPDGMNACGSRFLPMMRPMWSSITPLTISPVPYSTNFGTSCWEILDEWATTRNMACPRSTSKPRKLNRKPIKTKRTSEMRTTCLLILVLLPFCCCAQSIPQQKPDVPDSVRCECSKHPRRDGGAVCLSEKQMRLHIAHIVPLALHETHVKASGTLILNVRFQGDGSVGSVKALSGDPLAIAWAMEVVPKWTFKPIERDGKKYGGCGPVRVKFNLSDEKQETSVE
jgi:RHS repeat-associated protein